MYAIFICSCTLLPSIAVVTDVPKKEKDNEILGEFLPYRSTANRPHRPASSPSRNPRQPLSHPRRRRRTAYESSREKHLRPSLFPIGLSLPSSHPSSILNHHGESAPSSSARHNPHPTRRNLLVTLGIPVLIVFSSHFRIARVKRCLRRVSILSFSSSVSSFGLGGLKCVGNPPSRDRACVDGSFHPSNTAHLHYHRVSIYFAQAVVDRVC